MGMIREVGIERVCPFHSCDERSCTLHFGFKYCTFGIAGTKCGSVEECICKCNEQIPVNSVALLRWHWRSALRQQSHCSVEIHQYITRTIDTGCAGPGHYYLSPDMISNSYMGDPSLNARLNFFPVRNYNLPYKPGAITTRPATCCAACGWASEARRVRGLPSQRRGPMLLQPRRDSRTLIDVCVRRQQHWIDHDRLCTAGT
jgi:hypothetical protein